MSLKGALKDYESAQDNCGRCKVAIGHVIGKKTGKAQKKMNAAICKRIEQTVMKKGALKLTAMGLPKLVPAVVAIGKFLKKECPKLLGEIQAAGMGKNCVGNNSAGGAAETLHEKGCMKDVQETLAERVCKTNFGKIGPMCKPKAGQDVMQFTLDDVSAVRQRASGQR